MNVKFISHHPDFDAITGSNPIAILLAETDSSSKLPLFHEACVFHAPSQSVFVTSNHYPSEISHATTSNKQVRLSRVYDDGAQQDEFGRAKVEDVTPPSLQWSMLNGGVNYGQDAILLCAQGSLEAQDPSGLVSIKVTSLAVDPTIQPVVTNFHSIVFNSVNDVIIHPTDGSIWFTDPCYGHHQGIRPPPRLPNQVYRFDPQTKTIRAIADGFTRPNGLAFSPDLTILYITDTGALHGSPEIPIDFTGPSHIYAFDIIQDDSGHPFLTNRRLFAFAPGRIPDGIKCDTKGNVYSGCGDGVEVWNSHGVLLGVIKVPGGVANFCFGEKGTMYLCNKTRLWKIRLTGQDIKGALLGI
ncbi:putative smp-30 gluconolaconase lre-like region [Phaeomoniella chlamydospora]|uniref:Putative smp-30 gluconolaconase lre-like region n=1 Tax=Phaeomoniella chlamydospora TaxID=158046 RepID=A0A0G2FUD0_PHACM|nr:putative smp-30 gluconolaconase lre-like region [Phaeomoniella chlamydospora]